MLENGEYSAWFRTPQGQGTGTVTLANGRITGGDSAISYQGTYERDGDRFTATVNTFRHCNGQPSIFGIDELELRLVGQSRDFSIVCHGTAEQAPGLAFHATLIRKRDLDHEQVSAKRNLPSSFKEMKLPKIGGSR